MVIGTLQEFVAKSDDVTMVYKETCSTIDTAIGMLNAVRDRAKLEYMTMKQEGK